MRLGRSFARYGLARGLRSTGASYSFARALSLLALPWRRRG